VNRGPALFSSPALSPRASTVQAATVLPRSPRGTCPIIEARAAQSTFSLPGWLRNPPHCKDQLLAGNQFIMPPRSQVWAYFNAETDEDKPQDQRRVYCTKCTTSYPVKTATSTLYHHLEKNHFIFLKKNPPKKRKTTDDASSFAEIDIENPAITARVSNKSTRLTLLHNGVVFTPHSVVGWGRERRVIVGLLSPSLLP
jgi:hypothetical protein